LDDESDAACRCVHFHPIWQKEVHAYRGLDFGRFVEIATGSLFEVVSQTTVALRRRMIAQNDYKRIYAAAEKQSKVLSGLRRSLSAT